MCAGRWSEVKLIARIIKDPEVRAAELLDAARQLFSAEGYEKTMIIDITKKAGVAKGTFYYYFPTKEAVLKAIMADHAMKFVKTFNDHVVNANAVYKLKIFIESLYVPSNIDAVFHQLRVENRLDLFNTICKQGDKVLKPLLADVIKQGNQEGVMHVLLIDETIAFIWKTLECLWESRYHKEAPEIFAGKVTIAEVILEQILKMTPGSFQLAISLK